MKINKESIEIYILLFSVSIVFLILGCAIIYFVLTYRKKQLANGLEKKALTLHYESEILKTQIEVQEQTMQTIAADLHDNIGQLLSLTNLTLSSIDLKNLEKSGKKIDTSINLVNISIKELRDLAKLFQGEQLIEIGLNHAIQQEINWLEKSERYHIKANIELGTIIVPAPNKDLIILRLLQEILNNIIKHAAATEVAINAYIKENFFYLIIQDNGVGFDYNKVSQVKNGLGLHSLHKRIQLINGKIEIESSAKGTNIAVEIPYP